MTEERIPTFLPGDEIVYVVYLSYPANIERVRVTFRHEENVEWEISIWSESSGGQVEMVSEPRIEGTRTHVAVLKKKLTDQWNARGPRIEPGIYRLVELTATTYYGKTLNVEPPDHAFRYASEPGKFLEYGNPEPSVLTRSALLRPTGFHFPEGHPDRPQGV